MEPSEHDPKLLRELRDQLKAKLYAEYGETIECMLREQQQQQQATAGAVLDGRADGEGQRLSPAAARDKHLHDLLSDRTPLRQQVAAAQSDAIQRLVQEARESQERGEHVPEKLAALLAMHPQTQPTKAPSEGQHM